MPLLLLFIALPLIEIALFIWVGSAIGVGLTLLLILLSAMLGVSILRGQQARAMEMMQNRMRVEPGTLLAQGAFKAVSGILLILPGFLTDTIGLLLLIPQLQRAIVGTLAARANVTTYGTTMQDDIIEGEFEERDPHREPAATDHQIGGQSGWRRDDPRDQ